MKKEFDILVLSDLHYTGPNEAVSALPQRRSELGPVLIEKAVNRLRHKGVSVDLIILLGDLIDNGSGENASENLEYIASVVAELKLPLLVVSGNHDGDPIRYKNCFGCEAGLHKIGGYGFLVFNDSVGEGDVTTRSDDDLLLPARVAAENPDLPLVVLQHNPVHPEIEDSSYPYMLTNNESVLSGYADAGVILSLSGHYHAGQPAHKVGEMTGTEACLTVNQHSDADMTVYTVPALCEDPFRFAHVTLKGREVTVNEQFLKMDIPDLVDTHCHTEYAYCGTSVSAKTNAIISEAMGLQGLCLTEHAFQLYFEADQAWSFKWQTNDALVEKAWNSDSTRMAEFRKFAAGIRSDYVRVGLEVDMLADGSLLLAEDDREGWDLLIGSVHTIPGIAVETLTQSEAEKYMLEQIEKLLVHPIQVLAHPFRFFRRGGLEQPVKIYEAVAEMLASSGIAAEINYHTNFPDERFIKECLKRGVKIALGTDSHARWEVGEMYPHLALLQKAGVDSNDLEEVLFRC